MEILEKYEKNKTNKQNKINIKYQQKTDNIQIICT